MNEILKKIDEIKEFVQSSQKSPTYNQLLISYNSQHGIIKNLEKANQELSDRVVKAEGLMSEEVMEEPLEHDGCRGCKYEDKTESEYPCNKCKNCYANKWEARQNETVEGDQ